jgi:hypothetical protein
VPVDLYIGLSVEELQELLRAAQLRRAGGNITEVTAAGIRTAFGTTDAASMADDIFQIRYSLFLRAPSEWPDPRLERITRTRTRYQ